MSIVEAATRGCVNVQGSCYHLYPVLPQESMIISVVLAAAIDHVDVSGLDH